MMITGTALSPSEAHDLPNFEDWNKEVEAVKKEAGGELNTLLVKAGEQDRTEIKSKLAEETRKAQDKAAKEVRISFEQAGLVADPNKEIRDNAFRSMLKDICEPME